MPSTRYLNPTKIVSLDDQNDTNLGNERENETDLTVDNLLLITVKRCTSEIPNGDESIWCSSYSPPVFVVYKVCAVMLTYLTISWRIFFPLITQQDQWWYESIIPQVSFWKTLTYLCALIQSTRSGYKKCVPTFYLLRSQFKDFCQIKNLSVCTHPSSNLAQCDWSSERLQLDSCSLLYVKEAEKPKNKLLHTFRRYPLFGRD